MDDKDAIVAALASRQRLQLTLFQLFVFMAVCAGFMAWRMESPRTLCCQRSGRSLDLAILGRGHFQILDPESGETRYTRYGRFSIDRDGQLVFGEGPGAHRVDPQIDIPSGSADVKIEADGIVIARRSSVEESPPRGQLQLVSFKNPDGLREVVPGIFAETNASGTVTIGTPGSDGFGYVAQGWIENRINKSLSWTASRIVMAGTIVALIWAMIELRRQCKLNEGLLEELRMAYNGCTKV